jgi:hypothetical protein
MFELLLLVKNHGLVSYFVLLKSLQDIKCFSSCSSDYSKIAVERKYLNIFHVTKIFFIGYSVQCKNTY